MLSARDVIDHLRDNGKELADLFEKAFCKAAHINKVEQQPRGGIPSVFLVDSIVTTIAEKYGVRIHNNTAKNLIEDIGPIEDVGPGPRRTRMIRLDAVMVNDYKAGPSAETAALQESGVAATVTQERRTRGEIKHIFSLIASDMQNVGRILSGIFKNVQHLEALLSNELGAAATEEENIKLKERVSALSARIRELEEKHFSDTGEAASRLGLERPEGEEEGTASGPGRQDKRVEEQVNGENHANAGRDFLSEEQKSKIRKLMLEHEQDKEH